MTDTKKASLKKDSKNGLNKKIHDDLTKALGSYEKQLGEKKLEKIIKKITKLFEKGFKKTAEKEAATPTTAKKSVIKKKPVNS